MAGDVRGFYGELGVKVPQSGQTNVDLRCFAEGDAHKNGDRKPSLSLNIQTGQWHCHGCGASGGTYKAALALGLDKAAALRLEERFGLREASNGLGEIVAEYDYTDEAGELLFQVVRFAPKDFRQRKPDGNGGWEWKLGDTRRVLFRLPKLREAIGRGEDIMVVEGERDVAALEEIGVVATCNPMGAGKWRREFSEALRAAKVTVIADKDDAGYDHARTVARALRGVAETVDLVEPTKGQDIHAHLAAGGSLAELVELPDDEPQPTRDASELSGLLVADILATNPELSEEDLEGVESAKELLKLIGGKGSIATEIIDLVKQAGAVLFHDDDQTPFASFSVDGHTETWPIKSRAFRLWVRGLYYREKEAAPSGQALTDALGVLEAEAIFQGVTTPVHFRVAGDEHAIYIDLGDPGWQAIVITAEGWQVLDHHPVRFRRTGGMAPLPVPERGGDLNVLREFVNVADDDAWRLFVGWLLAAARGGLPCPVLVLFGEQGSAKSTAAKVGRELLDPSAVMLRAAPHDLVDLMVSATSSWVVAYDNLSGIQQWLSDALCRLSTGGGFSKRELYTDADEFLLDAMRPVAVNGIEELATRSDLLDRALLVEMPTIPDENRRGEEEFWAEFRQAHGKLLGGLCDALSGALAEIDTVELDSMPRMADFARWVTAAEPALGWEPGTFLESYTANRGSSHELALEASPVGALLRDVATEGFDGTMSELLGLLATKVDEQVTRRKEWPKNARALGAHLKRLAPNLRALGFEVTLGRESRGRTVSLEGRRQ